MKSERLKQLYEEIKAISDNQEVIIEERTSHLKVQNEKIIKYAFMNSHKLRAPIARILGLIYLSKLDKSGMDLSEIFNLINREVAELDQVVREINEILDEESIKGIFTSPTTNN